MSQRGKGFSNEDFNKARRTGTLDSEKQHFKEFKRSQRAPYDPAKERVLGVAGLVPLDRTGRASLYVEYVSYDNGPLRIQLVKRGTTYEGKLFDTSNLGKLWPEQASKLAQILVLAEIGRAHV